ncbi:hypothetical protein M422DRAFT_173010 [Sphaerobolus stellatus SS14]|uniref:PPM-type phosphatase domain-containing protein n=1 Tax=Sphaerobolus stellatus (strain SS14) TaxID=990650 RepID=A0A0C9VRN6_SPHS4|nr:hypothetical protein M422DRAFT_173010 [Sphaerobolus stellatus SS14]
MTSPPFSDSPNARSKTITTASGPDTHGALNQLPLQSEFFDIGIAEDRGSRRTMEDAYGFVSDFANVKGQGYFAIFDGHAGKHAAEWCGAHFHEYLLTEMKKEPTATVPQILNNTFHSVDQYLSKLAEEGTTHSGCTAVTAFLRIEDEKGGQSFIPALSDSPPHSSQASPQESDDENTNSKKKNGSGSRIGKVVKSLSDNLRTSSPSKTAPQATSPTHHLVDIPASHRASLRRVLYTANVGDARAVLCRGGKAVRLTYDHKGSDKQEAKRIMDAGGFVMNNRVNGVLAVTRSLGDSSMKEFVVGSPYTTETELSEDDEFLVIACDGLWDVAEDQKVVDLVRSIHDAPEASKVLLQYALEHFTTDNVTVLVVRFKN